MANVQHAPSDMEARKRFAPSYDVMLQMATQLLAERIGEQGVILVLGVGGGLEIEAFSARMPSWRYLGVDPDQTMLDAARERARSCGAGDKVSWVNGYVFDAPSDACDGGACLLTLHFVRGAEAKLETLKAVHARLKKGAPFVLVDLCFDNDAPDYELRLQRYWRFAVDSGADPGQAAATRERVRAVIDTVSPSREEGLLREAGFGEPDLFYAGLSWRGWLALA